MLFYILQEIFLNKVLLLCVICFPHEVAPVFPTSQVCVCMCVRAHTILLLLFVIN